MTAPSSRYRGRSRASGGPRPAGLADAVVIAGLVTVASLALGATYGGTRWLVAAAGGALAGALVVWVGSRLRWAWWAVALACAVAYLVFGAWLAVPSTTVAGVIPSVESVRLLTVGVIGSWRQLLTVSVPVGISGALMVPVYLAGLVCGAAGGALAAFARRPGWALIAPLAMMVVAALFGTTSPWWPVVSGLGVALGGLLWAAWRAGSFSSPGIDAHKLVSGVVVLTAALAAGAFLGPQIDTGDRFALREAVQPPFDPQQFPSPLVGFRKYFKDQKDVDLFTVSGLPTGARIRLAALDTYDGVSFSPSSSVDPYRKVGEQISGSRDEPGSAVANVDVTIDGYHGVFLPLAGRLTALQFESIDSAVLSDGFRYSKGNATGVVTGGVQPGDRYRSDVVVTPRPEDQDLSSVTIEPISLPPVAKISDVIKAAAGKLTEQAQTPYQKVLAIQKGLAEQGFLSHGGDGEQPSASGHGLDRLSALVGDKVLVGDQEQFAPAMVLMLRSLGIPARVVMGFAPTPGESPASDGGSWTVRGENATAWVEVPFAGVGWVAFDPTPDDQPVEQQPDPPNEVAPRAQVLQPPPPPQSPQDVNADTVESGKNDEQNDDRNEPPPPESSDLVGQILIVVAGCAIPLTVLGGPVAAVLWLKARRRRRRRDAPVVADRFSGGWDQIIDTATDFGFEKEFGRTRAETAADLDRAFGGSTMLLARRADERVFGPDELDGDEAARFWADVDAAVLGLSSTRGRWRRLRAAISLRSLLHGRRTRGEGGRR